MAFTAPVPPDLTILLYLPNLYPLLNTALDFKLLRQTQNRLHTLQTQADNTSTA